MVKDVVLQEFNALPALVVHDHIVHIVADGAFLPAHARSVSPGSRYHDGGLLRCRSELTLLDMVRQKVVAHVLPELALRQMRPSRA